MLMLLLDSPKIIITIIIISYIEFSNYFELLSNTSNIHIKSYNWKNDVIKLVLTFEKYILSY